MVFIWFVGLFLPPIFRVLCAVQIFIGVNLRGSVEPAVDPVDEESFGEFSAVSHGPGVGFASFKLKVKRFIGRVCFQI